MDAAFNRSYMGSINALENVSSAVPKRAEQLGILSKKGHTRRSPTRDGGEPSWPHAERDFNLPSRFVYTFGSRPPPPETLPRRVRGASPATATSSCPAIHSTQAARGAVPSGEPAYQRRPCSAPGDLARSAHPITTPPTPLPSVPASCSRACAWRSLGLQRMRARHICRFSDGNASTEVQLSSHPDLRMLS